MTDTPDIVDRLRSATRDAVTGDALHPWMRRPNLYITDIIEAADEIERLRARAEELEGALKPFDAMAQELFARNWNRGQVVIVLDNPGEPHRLLFDDFLAVRAALKGAGERGRSPTMPDTAEARAREIVCKCIRGRHPEQTHAEMVDEIADALRGAHASGEAAMREKAAQAAQGMGAAANQPFPHAGTEGLSPDEATVVVKRDFAIATAIRALPLSGDEHEKEQP